MNLKNLTERFLYVENRSVQDTHNFCDYWEVIRFDFFHKLAKEKKCLGGYNPSLVVRFRMNFLNILFRGFIDFFILCKKRGSELFIFSHNRRVRTVDGLFEDIYTDTLINNLACSHIVVEEPFMGLRHFRPTKNEEVLSLGLPYILSRMLSRLLDPLMRICFKSFFSKVLEMANELEFDSYDSYYFRRRLCENLISYYFYRALLSFLKPKAILLVVREGKEYLLRVAKDLQIPCVELQHGSPTHEKFNYNLKSDSSRFFPDYFCSFGRFWNERLDSMDYNSNLVAVGFPYLEERKKIYNLKKEKKILFLSQATVNKDLATYAAFLASKIGDAYKICFRLHPQEDQQWEKSLSNLCHPSIEVFSGREDDLYKLFSECEAQVGVYSTALYEGLFFQCKTFVLQVDGSSLIDDSIYRWAYPVEKNQIIDLRNETRVDNINEIFQQGWKKNFDTFFRKELGIEYGF